MLENPRKGRQARNFTTNAPKILDLKSSQIVPRIIETTSKSNFLCVYRSPIPYGSHAGAKASRLSVNIALNITKRNTLFLQIF